MCALPILMDYGVMDYDIIYWLPTAADFIYSYIVCENVHSNQKNA